MRLIDVHTYRLKEFHHDVPQYAILSHTWGDEEVTFQEYRLLTEHRSICSINIDAREVKKKAGFVKIVGACRRAQDDKLGYLWCDTNCIDKTSSAELTEAINSMYAWYRDSEVCYAYLADVGSFDQPDIITREFRKSRWFTRGWTLQELLAPEKLLFFNKHWVPIENRQQLADVICGATSIHKGALLNRNNIPKYSVAQRMSWAASRQTSKQEDIAYCLLGIFDINMPLLYGEGSKAFTRLQEEILKVSDDQSIFAWDFLGSHVQHSPTILASSPSEFASCGSIVRDMAFMRAPYSMTNLGVRLQLPMIRTFVNETILVELNCSIELEEYKDRRNVRAGDVSHWRFPVWIWLRSVGYDIYTRSPSPTSRIVVPDTYPDHVRRKNTQLYAITNPSQVESWVYGIHSPIHHNSIISTGFHIVIGFGHIRPRTRTFEEAFLPGNFVLHQLPRRGSSALSHEVVSVGSYVVLLSIDWDHQQRPIERKHIVFMGQEGSAIRIMSTNDWNVLFRCREESCRSISESKARLNYIHDQMRRLLRQPTTIAEKNTAPDVQFERSFWKEHNGEVRVVVHLTFQEPTRQQQVS